MKKIIFLLLGLISKFSAQEDFPMLGRYGEGYPMRKVCSVDVPYKDVTVPDVVQRAVEGRPNISFVIAFYESFLEGVDLAKPDNIVAHPLVRVWWERSDEYQALKDKTKYFNKNVSMGLFDSVGIVQVDGAGAFPLGKMGAVNVNFHPSADGVDAYSPNNGVITYEKGAVYAKFWMVILSPFNDHDAFVGLVFVALNDAMVREFTEICSFAKPLDRVQKNPDFKKFLDDIFKGAREREIRERLMSLENDFFVAIAERDFPKALDLYHLLTTFPRDVVNVDLYRDLLREYGIFIN